MKNPLAILCQQMKLKPELVARWSKLTPEKAALALGEPDAQFEAIVQVLVALKIKFRVDGSPFAVTFDYAGIDALMRDDYWRGTVGMKPYPSDPIDADIVNVHKNRKHIAEPGVKFRRHVVALLLVKMIPSDPRVPLRFGVETIFGESGVTFRWKMMPTCVRERIEKGLANLGWFKDKDFRIE